jgi:hypothetical protein
VLFATLKKMRFGLTSEERPCTHLPPIIAKVPTQDFQANAASANCGVSPPSTPAYAQAGPAPKPPIIGTQRGMPYAQAFAADFVSWAMSQGLTDAVMVDDLVDCACREFASAMGRNPPVTRNFLTALKRVPGVVVHQDRRTYARDRSYLGKRTFYALHGADVVATTRQREQTLQLAA